MTSKEFKASLEAVRNPGIRTLDEALALSSAYDGPDGLERREADSRAIQEILHRISTQIDVATDYASLTHGERLVDTIARVLDGEVMNGGFHQYLSNNSGDTAEEAKGFLHEIGASHTLDLLMRATIIFPDGVVPVDRSVRNKLIDYYEDAHPDASVGDAESREYYKGGENIFGLLLDYIRNHREDFALPADAVVARLRKFADIRHYYSERKRTK